MVMEKTKGILIPTVMFLLFLIVVNLFYICNASDDYEKKLSMNIQINENECKPKYFQ